MTKNRRTHGDGSVGPTASGARRIARRLERAMKYAGGRDALATMGATRVVTLSEDPMTRTDRRSRTSACHAGWYLLGETLEKGGDAISGCSMGSVPDATMVTDAYGNELSWSEGGDAMAKTLGFERFGELLIWAGTHPEHWGNTHGSCMFDNVIAFIDPCNAKPHQVAVATIAKHWHGVAARL